jgi:hypothetical protein
MDSFERGLRQDIPLEAAADFFLKLKYGSAKNIDNVKFAKLQGKLKESAGLGAIGGSGPAPALGPTGMGQNMPPVQPTSLPAAGMGKHAESRAQERAHESLETKYEKHKHTGGERHGGNLGGLAGAVAGGAAGHKLGKSPAAVAAGALVGYASGKGIGKSVGTSLDAHKFKKHASERFVKAANGMFGEGMTAPGAVAPQVDMSQYMAMEQEGEQAEQENQAEFLRQKLQQAHTELQAAQDQANMANQQAQQLQMAQSQHEQQLQSAQQQSQLATQAAMQNVQHAHELAMQATTQALQAKDDSINTHQMAAQMRMAYQDLRGNIMDSVAQDAAAPIGEAIKAQGALASQPAAPPGADPNAMQDPQGAGPSGQPTPEGPAGQATPAAAGPTAAPAEGGEGPPNQANSDGGGGRPVRSGWPVCPGAAWWRFPRRAGCRRG